MIHLLEISSKFVSIFFIFIPLHISSMVWDISFISFLRTIIQILSVINSPSAYVLILKFNKRVSHLDFSPKCCIWITLCTLRVCFLSNISSLISSAVLFTKSSYSECSTYSFPLDSGSWAALWCYYACLLFSFFGVSLTSGCLVHWHSPTWWKGL